MTERDLSRRRFLGLAAGGSAAAFLLAACGDDAPTETRSTATTAAGQEPVTDFGGKTITTAVYAKNHASSPLYWQQFAPPGLTVKPVIVTSPADISRALAAGDLDFGLMGYYNTIIEASTSGMASRIICMCSRQGVGLIARADRGITTVADLAGKTIAVPPPGVQVLSITAALGKVGLALDRDVTAVPVAFADQRAVLERGDVDAYIGTEPGCTQSVVSGVGVRIGGVYDTPAGDINTAMWAAPKHLGDAALLTAVAKMQRDAAELLTPGGVNNRAEWRKLLVEQFEYAAEVYEAVLDNVGAVWRFDDVRKAQFEGAAELMLAQGVITTKPKIDDLLLLDYQPAS
ncbi:MAG TPA: ABC transporter substrate-binding protein [Acidimicrobiales bacterium]|nr:ABC transporter substrate-binding protein [Acidimicrobiales bacterium]